MGFKGPRAKVDMTIESESGSRERFACESEMDFAVKAYQYATKRWSSKSQRMRDVLLKELKNKLDQLDMRRSASFTIGGLKFLPTQDFGYL